jgi:hypothetical protein
MIKTKIILMSALITTSYAVYSQTSLKMSIPQPDYISNDWDGDGIINSIDDDSDNDGILDINDKKIYSVSGKGSYINIEFFCSIKPFGFWSSGMSAPVPDHFKTTHRDGLPIEYSIKWDNEIIGSANTAIFPKSISEGVSYGGYKYWMDETQLIHQSSPSSVGAVYENNQYVVCRSAI